MQTMDTNGRPVQPSWLNRLDGGFESPPIGLGIGVDPRDFALPNYYFADVVDEDGDLLHYVDDNETFIQRTMLPDGSQFAYHAVATNLADGNLIAAAPELCSELKSLVGWAEEYMKYHIEKFYGGNKEGVSGLHPQIETARAALAKARGES